MDIREHFDHAVLHYLTLAFSTVATREEMQEASHDLLWALTQLRMANAS